ncbi:MAG TPA: glycosyltransferase, partial [Actinomycetota bacterium]|nr:glycosyltransferase [Actinomycetota bacterium]
MPRSGGQSNDSQVRRFVLAHPSGDSGRVSTDGKFFTLNGRRFDFRGVTYGTFCPRSDGDLFPERDQMKRDFASISDAGFTVVRTYTDPPDDALDLAADWGLKILAGVYYPDWRYLVGCSRRQFARVARQARVLVRTAARRHAADENLAGLVVGNEIPADVVRWVGTKTVGRLIAELAEVVREEDPGRLVTYANYPTTEYLDLSTLDFLTFNVFLEDREDFRRYVNRLSTLAGDRPLVLGEIGFDSGGGARLQAELIGSQLEVALERGVAGTCIFSWTDEWGVAGRPVEGWHFGLTRQDRTPKPALETAIRFNRTGLADLKPRWPEISVVVCAHNAEATLDECLRHLCALDYPALEAIVVDDGSTDATADIARRYPVKLVQNGWGGLSAARNAGCVAATGEIVAYLDSDAYPAPEWPYYLALGFDAPEVVGVGGPNLPPPGCGLIAQQVARAPGGPVHVLLTDDRAEHVPGCNMAFWKDTLLEVGVFDPIYVAAGDDVDLCWRVLDAGGEIAFHPGALVWHHPRTTVGGYLRQQRGYGKAEALVSARHPNRFCGLGTARWRGFIYNSLNNSTFGQRVYRGAYGAALFQSVYRKATHRLDIAHQVGVPLALLALLIGPLLAVTGSVEAPLIAAGFVTALGAVDTARVAPPRNLARGRLRFRLGVALLHLLQPLVRTWGRLRNGSAAARVVRPEALPAVTRGEGNLLIFDGDRPREQFVSLLAAHLRRTGLRLESATGWEEHDLTLLASTTVSGMVTSSAFPEGCIQMRLRPKLRLRPVVVMVAAALLGMVWLPAFSGAVGAAIALETARGWYRV